MITDRPIDEILEENLRRKKLLETTPYDPLIGNPSDPCRTANYSQWHGQMHYIPCSMLADPKFERVNSLNDYESLRLRHDFEFWAARCVTIRHKINRRKVPFLLNAPQRRVLALLERDRLAERPLRMILLKARQWGGSTLIQMYFAWIQTCLRHDWNSLICAHIKDTAHAIRAMYSDMLAAYPEELWDGEGDEKPAFRPWQRSSNTNEVAGRGCKVTVSSSHSQDSARGLDFSMAHLSEVAFWVDSDRMSPEDFVRTIAGSITLEPLTMVVMESTANGIGNFFHSRWLLAEEGKSAYRPVFVPWHEIEIYRSEVSDPKRLIESLTAYERQLWDDGLTLEMIQWYHDKRSEFPSDAAMFAEYPTTAAEAFINTGSNVFASADIERMAPECREPLDVDRRKLPMSLRRVLDAPAGDGVLKLWALPPLGEEGSDMHYRYVAVVDVGGRWAHADYSVIAVFDRRAEDASGRPAIVAQWRGHCDHDLLARYAESMARAYGDALLVVESNSLESGASGSDSLFILEDLNQRYHNMYVREVRDNSGFDGLSLKVGFHTNRATKAAAVTALIAALRDGSYIERDRDALNEMAVYELQPSGGYAARRGYHDDLLMTRAIGLYVIASLPEPPTFSSTLRSLLL